MTGQIYTNQNDFPSGKSTLDLFGKKHLYIVKLSIQIKLTFGQSTNYVNGRPSVPSGLPGGIF